MLALSWAFETLKPTPTTRPQLKIPSKSAIPCWPSIQIYEPIRVLLIQTPQIVQLVLMEDLSLAMFSRTFLLFFIMTVHVNIYSLTLHSCQQLWSFSLFVIAILTAVRYKVKTILICIFWWGNVLNIKIHIYDPFLSLLLKILFSLTEH